MGSFKLSGVVTCVNFADVLAESLPLNRVHFDQLVVVTTPEDVETQRICRYYNVQHSQTDVFRSRWGEFHKAKGINNGLGILKRQGGLDGWVLHFDADIVLPPTARSLLERANMDKRNLYGCDRTQGISYDDWRLHQAMPILQQDSYHVHMPFPVAPRFSGSRMGGYAPPGYFQMWWAAAENKQSYPDEHTSAARTDVLFTAKWWRRNRALIPEFYVYHLESEIAVQGTNWGGRQTARWGPEPDRNAWHSPHHHRPPSPWPPHHHKHHKHHHHHPYGHGPKQEQA